MGFEMWLTSYRFSRVDECTMFKVVKVDGYICQAVDSTSPSPSEILSKYIGRPVHLVMKGPKYRACDATQTFPDLVASALFQDGFPLLVTSEESLKNVGDEVNRWASGPVDGKSIGGIDDMWKTSRIPIERYVNANHQVTSARLSENCRCSFRFRPNIVFCGADAPFVEDFIKELVISPNRDPPKDCVPINLVAKCTRCLVCNLQRPEVSKEKRFGLLMNTVDSSFPTLTPQRG